ncbi:SET domain-containing protein [Vitiosangium sp. GDMCC 1.1324]|uniref:SET domain-containing protein n=1 Tax=Vitiosangium sp. (strain GDMCC 1.1324) TaxID=2138576 RepID=UPI000D3917FF|nr:SET domain-containing protein-lysine N-methyltransferase [Vitiosangium sp. GDMCC 1.1324]PTL80614.1 SET domain-containing protein-lysine N-methyltransferase [Vitiosangium sp. GDMCC 1.1324]
MPAPTTKKPTSRKMPTLTPQPFELRSSSIQGQGAFATRPIRKGARIIEYVGQRISQSAADERYDDTAMSRHHTFLFNVDEDTVIDAAHEGNDARFINHSCDPNCQAFLEGDRIYIYARRDISVGDELCYDYAYDRTEDMGEEEERLYVCRCGAATCRGTILATTEEQKKEPRKKAPVKASKKSKKKSSSSTSTRKPPASRKRKSTAKSGRSASGAGSKRRARTRAARG